MRRLGFICFAAGMLTAACGLAATNDAPDFTEVRGLLRTNLSGISDGQLDAAAVKGLLEDFPGRVVLVTGQEKSGVVSNTPAVGRPAVFDDGVAYLRANRVVDGLAKELSEALQQLSASNKLNGLVLDLRFVRGDDYTAAAATAEIFSPSKKVAARLPVAVLVNGETSGAAEALAAAVRQSGAGLILGGKTAGRAAIMREFPLKNGQRLLIASAPVKLADGYALTAEDVKPDIAVAVKAEDERAYFADAYANLAKTNLSASSLSLTNQPGGTNRPARRRMSEADLVRKHRDGMGEDEDAPFTAARTPEPEQPVLRDPALARAVDLLKGLALVRQARSESK